MRATSQFIDAPHLVRLVFALSAILCPAIVIIARFRRASRRSSTKEGRRRYHPGPYRRTTSLPALKLYQVGLRHFPRRHRPHHARDPAPEEHRTVLQASSRKSTPSVIMAQPTSMSRRVRHADVAAGAGQSYWQRSLRKVRTGHEDHRRRARAFRAHVFCASELAEIETDPALVGKLPISAGIHVSTEAGQIRVAPHAERRSATSTDVCRVQIKRAPTPTIFRHADRRRRRRWASR